MSPTTDFTPNIIDIDRAALVSFRCAAQLTNSIIRNSWREQDFARKDYRDAFLDFLTADRADGVSSEVLELALQTEVNRVCAYLDQSQNVPDEPEEDEQRELLNTCLNYLEIDHLIKNSNENAADILSPTNQPHNDKSKPRRP